MSEVKDDPSHEENDSEHDSGKPEEPVTTSHPFARSAVPGRQRESFSSKLSPNMSEKVSPGG